MILRCALDENGPKIQISWRIIYQTHVSGYFFNSPWVFLGSRTKKSKINLKIFLRNLKLASAALGVVWYQRAWNFENLTFWATRTFVQIFTPVHEDPVSNLSTLTWTFSIIFLLYSQKSTKENWIFWFYGYIVISNNRGKTIFCLSWRTLTRSSGKSSSEERIRSVRESRKKKKTIYFPSERSKSVSSSIFSLRTGSNLAASFRTQAAR